MPERQRVGWFVIGVCVCVWQADTRAAYCGAGLTGLHWRHWSRPGAGTQQTTRPHITYAAWSPPSLYWLTPPHCPKAAVTHFPFRHVYCSGAKASSSRQDKCWTGDYVAVQCFFPGEENQVSLLWTSVKLPLCQGIKLFLIIFPANIFFEPNDVSEWRTDSPVSRGIPWESANTERCHQTKFDPKQRQHLLPWLGTTRWNISRLFLGDQKSLKEVTKLNLTWNSGSIFCPDLTERDGTFQGCWRILGSTSVVRLRCNGSRLTFENFRELQS